MADSKNLPYPFQFDPSQWSNKYSNFAGTSLNPYMGGYAGTPTDARGAPIQSYQDFVAAQAAQKPAPPPMAPATTLNSSPGAGYFQTPAGSQALGAQMAPQGSAPGIQALYGRNFAAFAPPAGQPVAPGSPYGAPGGGQPAAPAAGVAPPQSPDMGQAYLNALSNPGRVATPGATAPQAALPSQNSNVLQQFLANWQQGGAPTTGAGNYNNAGFFKALQGGQ
jgi:hypothetical protein